MSRYLHQEEEVNAARLEKRVFMEKVEALERVVDSQKDVVRQLKNIEERETESREESARINKELDAIQNNYIALQDKFEKQSQALKAAENELFLVNRDKSDLTSRYQSKGQLDMLMYFQKLTHYVFRSEYGAEITC